MIKTVPANTQAVLGNYETVEMSVGTCLPPLARRSPLLLHPASLLTTEAEPLYFRNNILLRGASLQGIRDFTQLMGVLHAGASAVGDQRPVWQASRYCIWENA